VLALPLLLVHRIAAAFNGPSALLNSLAKLFIPQHMGTPDDCMALSHPLVLQVIATRPANRRQLCAYQEETIMQSPDLTDAMLTAHYTTASDALAAIARAYYFFGRLSESQQLLRTALALLDTPEATPQQRLKLLLLYGQVLVVDHFLTRGTDVEPVFAVIQQVQQIADATQNRQRIADALSLLGQAHYFASVVANRAQGVPLTSTPGDGKYDQALLYQQQALALREALQDTRGMSESYFQIGVVYERWQQDARAQGYYAQARQIADAYDYAFEKTEPARHGAFQALREGDLDQALTRARQALALREAAGFRPYLPLDHLLLRDIYQAKGDTAQAQVHAQHAQTLAEELGLQWLVASVPNIRDALAAQRTRGSASANDPSR
jgi:tetratricopeptide (TPR) repeat protein